MNLTKLGRLVGDLGRVNRTYLTDGSYRNAIRERLAPSDQGPVVSSVAKSPPHPSGRAPSVV